MTHVGDLTTTYLGMKLRNPIVAAACQANAQVDMAKRLADAGISAIVMPSLFEEQIEFEERQFGGLGEYGAESFAEVGSYFPELDHYNSGPDEYLENMTLIKNSVPVPIIGSLNGVTSGGWTRYAKLVESAGADALELNMYYLAADPDVSGADVEQNYLDLVHEVKSRISIPLAVKIGPYFTSVANFAVELQKAGADGVILFNRFMQPDIDLDRMLIDPQLTLSTSSEVRLPLRWIAILHGRVQASLAATSGVGSAKDVIKLLLAGADVTMITSILMKKGPAVVTEMLQQMESWLEEHGYQSIEQLKGSMSYRNCPNPSSFERTNYMKALTDFQGPLV